MKKVIKWLLALLFMYLMASYVAGDINFIVSSLEWRTAHRVSMALLFLVGLIACYLLINVEI